MNHQGLSLAQANPRATESFAAHLPASHPFPSLGSAKHETSSLTKLLPSREDIHLYLHAFQRRSLSSSFPHVPEECTEPEVQRFLDNVEHNAAAHPNTLALLFATLAQGLQDGIYDRDGQKWIVGAVESELMKGDVYSMLLQLSTDLYHSLICFSCRGYASVANSFLHEPTNATYHPDLGDDGSVPHQQW